MTTQFTKLFSFILANVYDPAINDDTASRIPCYSCMSPYLEHQYLYVSHLYRRPSGFTDNFDARSVKWKNCSDMCITMRINDRVGGRRREGFLRGCMSDILHYNQTIASLSSSGFCAIVRMRDLFVSTEKRHCFFFLFLFLIPV
ncbi:unnamed protein product [Dracunculus medinensis]|uniref:Secreted protein n=1 Tax=Dracunculus medinensis TaxID=318479 RepID=A0A158Q354_DRAME|nr:unnamed protein product [Dracunculus medinensis]